MKTKLFLLGLLGCTVAGLQGGEYMDAYLANEARSKAILTAPVPGTTTQDKILEELQKQTKLLEAQQPMILNSPKATPVPVTYVPIR